MKKPPESLAAFWRNKRVLITGHTGFKGSWLTLWLNRLGAEVTGIGLPPVTIPSLFSLASIETYCKSYFCDIRSFHALSNLVRVIQPEIIFHLAAQPLVRASYHDPLTTFSTNVMGTAHVLEALRGISTAKVAVMVTTDKVYRNNEWEWPYREDDALGGHDPYSASKAASEVVIASYRESFLSAQRVAVASARAGNVIGGGDWSPDRLIPDAIRAWQAGQALEIRRPQATRPWQHVMEPLAGYIRLAQCLWNDFALSAAYNFGPHTSDAATVREVIELSRSAYGTGQIYWGDSTAGPYEAGVLALEIAKSKKKLGITPHWRLEESIQRTIHWYRSHHAGADAQALCLHDIVAYETYI